MRAFAGEAAQPARQPLRVLVLQAQNREHEHVVACLSQAGFAVEARRVDGPSAMQRELGKAGWNAVVATVPERERHADEQARQRKHLLAIQDVVAATSSTLDLDQVLAVLLRSLREMSGADRSGVMLLDPRTNRLRSAAARNADGPLPVGLQLARGEGAGGQVVEDGKPLVVPDLRAYPRFAAPHGASQAATAHLAPARGYAGFPLLSRGRTIGVASLISTVPRSFAPDEIALIDTLCRAAAVSVDNALAHQELRRRQEQEVQQSQELLRESERLRDSLIHMIVHDLRSPLSAVSGYLEVFAREARDKLGPELTSDMANATNAVRRMARMINEILDVHTMETQMMKLEVSECDLVEVVRQSLDELESLVGRRQVAFERPSVPTTVLADTEIVVRIVQNLLANALRLTPVDGEIRIGIVPAAEQTRVFVTDTGPGISADFRARIFDKHAHAARTVSCHGHTTGLGLTFCKLAVEAHGGQIGVESEEGVGSTFWFTLPSRQVTGDEGARATRSERLGTPEAGAGSVTGPGSQPAPPATS